MEIMQIYSITNILLKYNWQLNFINKEAAINLGLQNIEKYQTHAA